MSNITPEELERQKRNEETTKMRLITPIIEERWGGDREKIRMEYYFTAGKVSLEDGEAKREEPQKADYLLLFKHNIPLALVEAKGEDHTAMEGFEQVRKYAVLLDIPFAYTTNGHDLIEVDMLTGQNDPMKMIDFPYQNVLWERYVKEKGLTKEELDLINQPYYIDTTRKNSKEPRYYQRIAINKVVESIAKGQKRMLLVMATGTGKTFTAFQIVWRLYKSGTKKKILYLVDRNILADQSMAKDFRPFNEKPGTMVKLKNNKIQDTSHSIYFALYQQLKNNENDYYKQLPPDFFDLIIVDECHRGSASIDSSWHEILDYFSSATQIGLTATPKETEDISNIDYFCKENDSKPLYEYSLKQGIEDGYLAPYRVINVEFDIDKTGYQAHAGEIDEKGNVLEEKLYEAKEFDRKIVIKERRDKVAEKITQYMIENDCRYSKMIIFCESIEHAEAMVQRLANLNSDLVKENYKYVMKITGDDELGKAELENFVDPNSKYPVIAVTSELMSTGVDSETCETIVLDKTIGSMTEFKQIVGRGTRIKEGFEIDGEIKNKLHFTVIDFRNNYHKFEDPEFDGPPISVFKTDEKGSMKDGNIQKKEKNIGKLNDSIEIAYVNGVSVSIENEMVSRRGEDGKLVSERIDVCVKHNILDQYPTYEKFIEAFMQATNKRIFTKELLISEKFIYSMYEKISFPVDDFDIISMIAYEKEPMSKEERLNKIFNSEIFKNLDLDKQIVLKIILNQYIYQDFEVLKDTKAYKTIGLEAAGYSVQKINILFGKNKKNYINLMNELEKLLYL